MRRSYKSSSFDPLQFAVSAWLRNETLSGDIASVPDVINTNPATANSARRPAGEASGAMTFATNDCLSWPLSSENNGVIYWGCAFWVDMVATAGTQTFIAITNTTGGASARKIMFRNNSAGLQADVYIEGTNGRRFTMGSSLTANPMFLTLEIDTTVGGDDSVSMTIDGVVQNSTPTNLGTGGTITTLPTVTGNMLIGNGQDGVASGPLNGRMSRNIWILGSKMTGADEGRLLTAAGLTALSNFEPLV